MKVTLDPSKDASNLAKHGVPLSLAKELEWGDMLMWPDARKDYGEARMVGLAPLEDRLYCVIFVDRPPEHPTERRIISLRKANTREVKRYAENS
ncbi:MAG: BrnT family toxin [Aquabacterium sp.]|uniref:BrnT family toxin n=1 Tax=Aquabacterium sp. TaxID=1872578 RepID=UPI002719ADBA|nr:BrnT family toxin [Aquabacterium sp.]MDO9002844.1 BrnT family toxin [Aquabacterium sp.]